MPCFFFHVNIDLNISLSTVNASADQIQHSKLPESSSKDSNASERSTNRPNTPYDWRSGNISHQTVAMAQVADSGKPGEELDTNGHLTNGISAGPGGLATKGRYEPCDPLEESLGWGVVRLYRDGEETPGLYDEPTSPSKHSRHSKASETTSANTGLRFRDEDCTTLCILAVPSYLTPSDFLGFVGEKTRDEVSHFRMIRTERSNRYMVLMKFRNGKKARQWRREWNGKAFDGMEPEHCHVVFIKSISFHLSPSQSGQASSFPDMTNDPFTPSVTFPSVTPSGTPTIHPASTPISSSTATASRKLTKPAPPPTPALIELPTCPVCLERMDESTGLLTILCQHVFHCSCLQKWKGSGCPVCRYTHSTLPLLHQPSRSRSAIKHSDGGLNECAVCHSDTNLWICLICGSVGCGRYDAAHAFAHYESSGHAFAMELDSQRVWDYASDVYVHRIIQDQTNGKFLEMTHDSRHINNNHNISNDNDNDDFDDYVPREKLTNIGLEYTALLTSQLDSQRLYFEEALERAADKASRAALAAEKATLASQQTSDALAALHLSHSTLLHSTLPELEKDRDRAAKRAERFELMARKLEREWRDEKAMNASLMQRVQVAGEETGRLRAEKEELEEQNRDLGFFISGGQRLQALVAGGQGQLGQEQRQVCDEEEVREGTVTVPAPVPAPVPATPGHSGKHEKKEKEREKEKERKEGEKEGEEEEEQQKSAAAAAAGGKSGKRKGRGKK